MKRNLLIVLTAALLAALLAPVFGITAQAAEITGTCGTEVSWSLDQTSGTLTISGQGAIESHAVSNGDLTPWYSYRASIRSVEILEGVTAVGSCAFQDLTALETVTISSSVTELMENAFAGCSNLKSVQFSQGLLFLGVGTFRDCSSLGSVTLPEGLISIGAEAFSACESLEEAVLPQSLQIIGDRAFYGCSSLEAVTIPAGVTRLGSYAFSRCEALTEFNLEAELTALPEGVLAGDLHLRAVSLPDTLLSIGDSAFSLCVLLQDITMPEGVSLGENAFYGCIYLDEDGMPLSETAAEDADSGWCAKAAAWVYDPDTGTLTIVGSGDLTDYPTSCTYTMDTDSSPTLTWEEEQPGWSTYSEEIQAVEVLESITALGESTFADLPALETAVLPASLTFLGDRAFACCISLQTVQLPEDAQLQELGAEVFLGCTELTGFELVQLEDGVVVSSTSMTQSVVPQSVTAIGDRAFFGCANLGTTELSEDVALGEDVFYGCADLTEVEDTQPEETEPEATEERQPTEEPAASDEASGAALSETTDSPAALLEESLNQIAAVLAAHSSWILLGAVLLLALEGGILLTIFFIWLLLRCIVRLFRRKTPKEKKEKKNKKDKANEENDSL